MKNELITRINGAEIISVQKDGEILIPIRPICVALGINDKVQRDKIQKDDILSSVEVLNTSTGSDGKQYEMSCLPLEYVYGWLFTINPERVHPDAKEAVKKYRRECYEVLYRHFFGALMKSASIARREAELLRERAEEEENRKKANANLKRIDTELGKLSAERLDDTPTLF